MVDLLEQARDRNKRQGVTGVLLYAEGIFFQVLEGEERDVDDVYAAILRDGRNRNNILSRKRPINVREFGTWLMGFKRLSNAALESLDGFSDFLDRTGRPIDFPAKGSTADTVLEGFKEHSLLG
ncbi:MAG: BLUF domain-containing protein [Pseudomonadota bacterium]